MSAHCHDHHASPGASDPRYRKILWLALVLNAAMFFVELGAGFKSGSVSLLADAIDFFGDAANYAVTLAVLSSSLAWRAWAAVLKGLSMFGFGLFVLGRGSWSAMQGVIPEPATMGAIGLLALIVNVFVTTLLYAYREGDANMRSVWLCSRNDAIGNIAIMLAALAVLGTHTAWPDLAVALVMGLLAISSGWSVLMHARREIRSLANAPRLRGAKD